MTTSPTQNTPLARILIGITQCKPEGMLVIMGLLLIVVAQWMRVFPDPVPKMLPATLTVGVIMILVGVQAARNAGQPGWVRRLLQIAARTLDGHEAQILLVFVGVWCAVLAALSIDYGPNLRVPSITIGVWLLAILLVGLGGWRVEGKWPARRTLALALGITILAFIPRALFVGRIPNLLTSDEASMGLNAAAFVNGKTNNLFNVGWFSFPSFYYYLESFSVWMFGQTVEALRLFSALAGALTVGAVYLLARAMFGKPTALLAALFLTGFHFHVHFSRLGLNNIWDGLAFTLTMGALWYGWRHSQRGYFLLAGAMFGFAQYLYASARLLFILIPVWVILAGFFDRERLRRALPGLVWMALMAFVIFAPLAWYYVNHPNEYLAPLNRVSLSREWFRISTEKTGNPAWVLLAQQIWIGLKGYTSENIRFFYAPNTPMLRPMESVFFIVGVAMLLLQPTDSRHTLLALWLLGFGIISGLSVDPPSAQRYVAAAPSVALIVGVGLHEITITLSKLIPKAAFTLSLLAIVGVLWLAVDDLRFYFWDYSPRTAETLGNDLVANRLAHYLEDQPIGTQVYFFGAPRMGFSSHASVPYLVPQVNGFDMALPWNAASLPGNPAGGSAMTPRIFVFLPEYSATLSEVQASFPGGTVHEETTANGPILYMLYEGEW